MLTSGRIQGEICGLFRLFFKRTIPPFRIIFWTVVLYEIITLILAPPLETIVAVSAVVGLSVGLASQDILKNIFGGIVILPDHPFQVGDKIQAGGHYGEVKQIGLRTMRIQTPDDNLVSIPNAEIMNQAVSNANACEPNCQVVARVYLPALGRYSEGQGNRLSFSRNLTLCLS